MATTAKKTANKYVVKSDAAKSAKTVSARVPEDLFNKFNAAVKLATENGYALSITAVMHTAMRDAIKELAKELGPEKVQGSLDL